MRNISKVHPKVKLYSFDVKGIFKDDAFMLSAAIIHDSYLISNDAYRDHMALLPPKTKALWKQWLVSRQIICLRSGIFAVSDHWILNPTIRPYKGEMVQALLVNFRENRTRF